MKDSEVRQMVNEAVDYTEETIRNGTESSDDEKLVIRLIIEELQRRFK